MGYQKFKALNLGYTRSIVVALRETATDIANKYRKAPKVEEIIQHSHEELEILYEIAAGMHDIDILQGYVVQCGAFCGGSACAMGRAIKDANKEYAPVLAIDSYTKSYGPLRELFNNAYRECRENIWANNLQDYVTLVVSDDALFLKQFWDKSIRVAFVDSSHHYEHTKEEITLLMPHIVDGGWIIFDDYFSDETPGVAKAVNEFIESSGRRPVTIFRADGLLLMQVGNAEFIDV